MRSAIGVSLKVSLVIASIVCAPSGGTAQEPIDLALMLGTALKEFYESERQGRTSPALTAQVFRP